MTKPRLTYFDSPMSRGEECRLAFSIAGVDFEDVRIKREEWPALKPQTPFGSIPVLELTGRPVLAQSNAILAFIGRSHGLHPKDDFEAARHEAIMAYVEDLRANVSPTIRMPDGPEKKQAREALASTYIPDWAGRVERQIGDGPFFGGTSVQVADVKLYMAVRWFAGGKVDHIPANVFEPFPKLVRLHDAVRDHAAVKAWYART